jgi:hypothetical protein
MRQAFHILRKDARRFRYQICMLAALTAAFAWSTIVNDPYTPGALANYLHLASAILPITWWPIMCVLIQDEPLVGDRQFWVTRPYSRWSLLAAKALFIVLFMNVPLLIAGFVILAAAGFQPLAYLPELLWMQLLLVGTLVVPTLALASITRGLMQCVLAMLGIVTCFVVLAIVFSDAGQLNGHPMYSSGGIAWAASLMSNVTLLVPALVILVLQWRMRRRWIAIGAGAVLFLLPQFADSDLSWRIGSTVQSRMFGERGAEATAVTLKPNDVGPDTVDATQGGVALAVRLHVINIPAGETVAPEIVEMTFEGSNGERWRTGWTEVMSSMADVVQKDPEPDGKFAWWQRVVMDRGFHERARFGPVTIRGSVYLMLNKRSRGGRLPDSRAAKVPGGGVCTVSRMQPLSGSSVTCLAPFHLPFQTSDFFFDANRRTTRLLSFWSSPIPTDLEMSPVRTMSANNVGGDTAGFVFLRYEPRAYIHRYFIASNVRLPCRPGSGPCSLEGPSKTHD